MTGKEKAERENLFGHPDMKGVFETVFSTLVQESDRGAVVIGASIVDQQLRGLFEAIAPSKASKKDLSRLLDYPGPLSSFYAKAEVAFACRYISAQMKRSIDILRRLRNEVAHSPESFRLEDHEQALREMFELGPGVPVAVNRMAVDLLVSAAVRLLLETKDPLDESDEPLFNSPREVAEYLRESPDLIKDNLEPRRLRWELGTGIALLCALIVSYRDRAGRTLGKDSIIGLRKVN